MSRVRTELEIDAPCERLYRILTDFPAYPSWNPVIRRIRGEARVGGMLRFWIHLPTLPPLHFVAKVMLADPEKGLAWRGGPHGVFTAHHYVRFERITDELTRLVHGEDFDGILRPLVVPPFILGQITHAYDVMNASLAARVRAIA